MAWMLLNEVWGTVLAAGSYLIDPPATVGEEIF
jgi:hypothetical protein